MFGNQSKMQHVLDWHCLIVLWHNSKKNLHMRVGIKYIFSWSLVDLYFIVLKYFEHVIIVMSVATCCDIGDIFAWLLCKLKKNIFSNFNLRIYILITEYELFSHQVWNVLGVRIIFLIMSKVNLQLGNLDNLLIWKYHTRHLIWLSPQGSCGDHRLLC